jgi:hypothetical protein
VSEKNIQPLRVVVDELTLSLLGWQISDISARLVTTSHDKREHFQEIVVSGTARFFPEDWSERFSNDDHAPTLLLSLSRIDSPAPPNYTRLAWDTVQKVAKRPQRFSEKSMSWECKTPLTPEEIKLRITAFDLEEVASDFELPPVKVTALPVEVIDETSRRSVQLQIDTTTAHIHKGEYDAALRVHLEGTVTFGAAAALLADHLASDEWRDQDATLEDECPFEVDIPGLVVEVLDEDGFMLERRENVFYSGCVPVAEFGELPNRQPRWLLDSGASLDEYPGAPTRVVLRVMDAEDL